MEIVINSLIFSMILTIIITVIRGFMMTDRRRINKVKRAMEQNHIVHAKLLKSKIITRSSSNNRDDIYDKGIYEYEYNGKKYRSVVYERVGHLPKEIDLFYEKNPRKAVSEYELGQNFNPYICFIICFAILCIIHYI